MDGTEDYLPLWLELHLDDEAWLFELRAGEERAVVVGSHPTADVHVARHGVASTHFHFERERGGIVVVPGYRAALIVDHVPAPEPAAIATKARIEFCGALLAATVHDVPPLHMLLQARHGTDRMMRAPDYLERLPEDTDPTVVAVAAIAPAVRATAGALQESDDDLDLLTTTAWRASAPPTSLGPQGTLIMLRPEDNEAPLTAAEPSRPPSLPPIAPPERIRLDTWSNLAAASTEPSPTRIEVPHPHGARTRPATANAVRPAPLAPHVARTATPSLAPTGATVPPAKKRAPALERLGVAASRHPFRVAAAALPICAVFALAFVGAARLTGRAHIAPAASALIGQKRLAASPATSSNLEPSVPRRVHLTNPPVADFAIARSAAPPEPVPSASAAAATARPTAQRAPRPPKRVFLRE